MVNSKAARLGLQGRREGQQAHSKDRGPVAMWETIVLQGPEYWLRSFNVFTTFQCFGTTTTTKKSQIWIHTLLGLIYATCPTISHTISNNDKDTI